MADTEKAIRPPWSGADPRWSVADPPWSGTGPQYREPPRPGAGPGPEPVPLETRRVISTLRQRSPGVVELAMLLSLAVHLEMALIRQIRLDLLPHLDVGTEHDLWFSPLVSRRSAHTITLKPDIAHQLQQDLRERHCRLGDPTPARAWSIVERMHTGASPTERLEELLAWTAVSTPGDPLEALEALLSGAVITLTDRAAAPTAPAKDGPGADTGGVVTPGEERDDEDTPEIIAYWATQALPRMPPAARRTVSAWLLEQLAYQRLDLPLPTGDTDDTGDTGDGVPARLDVGPALRDLPDVLSPARLDVGPVLRDLPDALLPVRLSEGELIFNDAADGSDLIRVPDMVPVVLDVFWDSLGGWQERTLRLAPGARQTVRVDAAAVSLRTLHGCVYELVADPAPARPATPVVEPPTRGDVERLRAACAEVRLPGDRSRALAACFVPGGRAVLPARTVDGKDVVPPPAGGRGRGTGPLRGRDAALVRLRRTYPRGWEGRGRVTLAGTTPDVLLLRDLDPPPDVVPLVLGHQMLPVGTRVLLLACREPGEQIILAGQVAAGEDGPDGFAIDIPRPRRPTWSAEGLTGAIVTCGDSVVGVCRRVLDGSPYRASAVAPRFAGDASERPVARGQEATIVPGPSAARGRTLAVVVGVEHCDVTPSRVPAVAATIVRCVAWLRSRHVPDDDIRVLCSPAPHERSILGDAGIEPKPATRDAFHAVIKELRQATDVSTLWLFWYGPGVADRHGYSQRLFYVDATVGDELNLDLDDLVHTCRTTSFTSLRTVAVAVDLHSDDAHPAGPHGEHSYPAETFGKGRLVSERSVSTLVGVHAGRAASPEPVTGFAETLLAELETSPTAAWPPNPIALRRAVRTRFESDRQPPGIRIVYRDPSDQHEKSALVPVSDEAGASAGEPVLWLWPEPGAELRPIGLPVTGGQLSRRPVSGADLPTVVVPLPEVSHPHCQILPDGEGGWLVRDLASRNGTFLNGTRITEAPIHPGDILWLGRGIRFRVGAVAQDEPGDRVDGGRPAGEDE